jgi:hypothetical protein
MAVEGDDLAIEKRRPSVEFGRYALGQRRERFELISVPGDQAAVALVDVGECPEAVSLHFGKPFSMGKWVVATTEPVAK